MTGNLLIPGAVYKGRKYLERLIDRIRKAVKAGKSVTVIVTEDKIQPTNIIKHWTRPSDSVALCLVSSAESCESGNP